MCCLQDLRFFIIGRFTLLFKVDVKLKGYDRCLHVKCNMKPILPVNHGRSIHFSKNRLDYVGDQCNILDHLSNGSSIMCLQTGPLAAYYKLPLNRVLVVITFHVLLSPLFEISMECSSPSLITLLMQFHDDMGLPCGVLRLQPKGGHGSHNGYDCFWLCTEFLDQEKICVVRTSYRS